MFPSYGQHEFKTEQHYDPYPSHSPVSVASSASAVTPTSIVDSQQQDHQEQQQQFTYQQQPQNNGGAGGYNQQYSQPWPGSPQHQPQQQPSPQQQQQPQNAYYGPGPGSGDGGTATSGGPSPGPGQPPSDNGGGGGYPPPTYNNLQSYPPPPPQSQQSINSYYAQQQQQCNQSPQMSYEQYNYNYNGGQQQWAQHPAPGGSPPLGYPGAYGIKNEHYEMKPSPPGPLHHHHPGAIHHPYYGGNGHVSPHSPHLMGMQQQQPPQQPMHLMHQDPRWAAAGSPGSKMGPPTNGKRPKETQPKITEEFKAVKKPRASAAAKRANNRFNGMSEEEVAKRGLPDYLKHDLDVVFIGINPSMFAAYTGKYYDGPGNHFWQALYLSGFITEPMSAVDDHKLLDHGIGFTNIVARTTRGLSDLSRKEIADGAEVLRGKLCKFKPKIAVFNGKAIYEVYSGQKKFMFGRQPEPLNDGATWLWVMPSSSARCAQLPRAVDKVPFYEALRKFRDYLTGRLAKIEDCDVVFANVSLRNWSTKIKTENSSNDGEVNPNLQPFTDGVPANVPQSVIDVIEDVVRQYDEPDGGTEAEAEESDNTTLGSVGSSSNAQIE